jgi:phosphoglycerol transferase MdoB-like AlkP superfamily enzyme
MLFWYLIVVTMGFYSFFRLLFLVYNWNLFQNLTGVQVLNAFFQGLRFDLWSICILAIIPFIVSFLFGLWRPEHRGRLFRWAFLFFQAPFVVINIGDTEFVNFAGRRITVGSFEIIKEMKGKAISIITTYPLLISICAVTLGFFIYLVLKAGPAPKMQTSYKKKLIGKDALTSKFQIGSAYVNKIAFVTFSVLFVFLASRGGWQTKPLNFSHAQIFSQPSANNLVINSTFSILQTVTRKSLEKETFLSKEQMLESLNANFPGETLLKDRPKAPQNVVIIILESFSLEHMGSPHHDKGFTPFLDELASKSLFLTNNFASARRSIEGIAAVLGGIPALMEEPFISSPFLTNYYLGLGTLLEKQGYHTSFFHGGANGTMYFDNFAASSGIKNYFGLNEYPNKLDFDGTWGIYDEPFLQWWLAKLNQFPKPFFSAVFTLSSHHPFKVPDPYVGKFPKGPSEIHESIGYTDYALRRFFEEASKQPWFNDTLFVLTADHTFKNWRPEYNNEIGRFKVPLIFYHPHFIWPKLDTEEVTSQIDILPSILDFLGYPQPEEIKLGRSVFRDGDRSVVLMLDHKYWLIKKPDFLTYEKSKGFHLFDSKDWFESKEIENPQEKEKLETELKASIQYFSEGMWDNRLYYPASR